MSRITEICRDPDCVCVNCGAPNPVWAHLPYHDAGMGQKCPNHYGAPLCAACHDYADGRAKADALGYSHIAGGRLDFEWRFRVLRRGLALLIEAGIVRVDDE